ncbi:MAG: hypothetical protein HN855_09980 [Anaerolineae bacterium]|nr:hypothetical protein [Anaerolineae bacterium]MBT7325478.1 hypothetical protein [Anaerolineae bacterium]
MTFRTSLSLFLIALIFAIGVASFQSSPGYMDADYYFSTGLQLAEGKGFTEPFLWNYLDEPDGIPHPSHAYWMPLASLVTALGLRLAPGFEFASAQWIFILLSAFIPPLTASLAFSLTCRRDLALIAAFLALFSGYYANFLTTTDTFTLYMLLGGSFLLALKIKPVWLRSIALGLLAALLHLSRADGAIWLVIAVGFTLSSQRAERRRNFSSSLIHLFTLFASYLSLILPWFLRNLAAFGAILAPGGDKMLWLTRYDQIFTYPADTLTLGAWLASGWPAILDARLWALKLNLGTILGVQSGILLLPFILLGIWHLRKNHLVRVGLFAWGITFFVMTLIFPFAGARGSFFHSGAALQPLWWALAPLGLEQAIRWMARQRKWRERDALRVFQGGLIAMSFLITASLLLGRLISPGAEQVLSGDATRYASIEEIIATQGDTDSAIIVSNPPGYFLASGRPALALPDGNIQTIFEISERYGARYLVLEPNAVTAGLMSIFNMPSAQENLTFIAEVEGAQIFAIETQP